MLPIWQAFWVLSRSRGYGGLGFPLGIAYSEISRYAQDHGLELDETVMLIGQMDEVYLDFVTKRNSQ